MIIIGVPIGLFDLPENWEEEGGEKGEEESVRKV
jgi:hypothetical protein